jgi:hypothetical protein
VKNDRRKRRTPCPGLLYWTVRIFFFKYFPGPAIFSAVVMFYQCIALNEGQKDKRMVELLKNKLPKKKKNF